MTDVIDMRARKLERHDSIMKTFTKNLPKIILCAFIVLLLLGIFMKEPGMMLSATIVVCLSCIGIG